MIKTTALVDTWRCVAERLPRDADNLDVVARHVIRADLKKNRYGRLVEEVYLPERVFEIVKGTFNECCSRHVDCSEVQREPTGGPEQHRVHDSWLSVGTSEIVRRRKNQYKRERHIPVGRRGRQGDPPRAHGASVRKGS